MWQKKNEMKCENVEWKIKSDDNEITGVKESES